MLFRNPTKTVEMDNHPFKIGQETFPYRKKVSKA